MNCHFCQTYPASREVSICRPGTPAEFHRVCTQWPACLAATKPSREQTKYGPPREKSPPKESSLDLAALWESQ